MKNKPKNNNNSGGINLDISPEEFKELANNSNKECLNTIKQLNKKFPGLLPKGLEKEFKTPYPKKMKTYTVGSHLFCDFVFSGKPKAICVEVITPGNGKDSRGKIRAQIKEDSDCYKKGEILEINTFEAVPTKQEFRKPNSVFRYVDTNYEWIK